MLPSIRCSSDLLIHAPVLAAVRDDMLGSSCMFGHVATRAHSQGWCKVIFGGAQNGTCCAQDNKKAAIIAVKEALIYFVVLSEQSWECNICARYNTVQHGTQLKVCTDGVAGGGGVDRSDKIWRCSRTGAPAW